MKLEIFRTADAVGRAVAEKIAATIEENPLAVLGLATGSSPVSAC
jgi:6-phosphogluconolactonase/glucosamine-6-phosphate isomerase/deaminase